MMDLAGGGGSLRLRIRIAAIMKPTPLASATTSPLICPTWQPRRKNTPSVAEHGGDGEPVGAGGALAEQPGTQQRDPDRGGVLEQNGTGRRSSALLASKRTAGGAVAALSWSGPGEAQSERQLTASENTAAIRPRPPAAASPDHPRA